MEIHIAVLGVAGSPGWKCSLAGAVLAGRADSYVLKGIICVGRQVFDFKWNKREAG
jgi:hypothetical protein